MSDEIRVNRSTQQPMARPEHSNAPMMDGMPQAAASSKMPWYILGAVVVILIILGVLFRNKLFGGNGNNDAMITKSSSGTYQAVFLTNGQVYFGKLSDVNSDYADLKDIYYLQVIQPQPLQGTPQQGQQAQQQQQPQISLVKLGNELHGPVDEMHIAKSQILFYEDLKDDGNVVKAIQAYKANPNGTQQPSK